VLDVTLVQMTVVPEETTLGVGEDGLYGEPGDVSAELLPPRLLNTVPVAFVTDDNVVETKLTPVPEHVAPKVFDAVTAKLRDEDVVDIEEYPPYLGWLV
jgi:hypothetical protein